jgi:hypothetical protein
MYKFRLDQILHRKLKIDEILGPQFSQAINNDFWNSKNETKFVWRRSLYYSQSIRQ